MTPRTAPHALLAVLTLALAACGKMATSQEPRETSGQPTPPAAAPAAAPVATQQPAPGAAEAGDAADGTTTPSQDSYAPKARKASALDQGTLTFMAYNLKNYLTMERGNTEGPKPERETKALLSMILDVKPDILGVCEIGADSDLADLQARLKAAGLDLPHRELCDGPDAVRNLGLLSRFPVTARNHQTNLSYTISARQYPFHRGILDATIEPAQGYKLHLLGTHLKSKREVEDGDQAEMRRNEALLLRSHIEKIIASEPDANLLVYGDMNDTKQTDTIKTLCGNEGRDDHLYDLWLRDRFGFTWTHCWISADIYARIDFLLYNKAFAPEILRRDSYIHHAPEWFTASDHRPLVLRFTPRDIAPGSGRKSNNR